MRHVSATAAIAHPRHRHHQPPENGMMVAHSAKNTGSIRLTSQVHAEPPATRNAATTEDMLTEMSWTRWPSVTDF